MAKLYFKYGTMGASKTAQALIAAFNYRESGKHVFLCKPATDTREGTGIMRSRIGLESDCIEIKEGDNVDSMIMASEPLPDVVICDEAQFLSPDQVDQLHEIAIVKNIPVLCYGLKADFQTHFFPGSKRLFEIAESLQEIKMVCACGRKATVNARFDANGNIITDGEQVVIGGNECYKAMCYECYHRGTKKQ